MLKKYLKKTIKMKTEKSNVEKFYEWMLRINSIHLANTPAMTRGFQIVATHKINNYEGRS